jgi:hypothetical protein
VSERILGVVIKDIYDHKREETHHKAEENDEHHDCQSEIIFVAEKLQFALAGWRRVEFVELCVLLAHGVEDARVRENDDEAGKKKAY